MALNLVALRNSLQNLLDKNNTTTSSYDISSGLNVRVQQIIRGDPEQKPIPNNMYPTVFVKLNGLAQEIGVIGNNAKREHEIVFSIIPITNYGASIGLDTAEDEIIRLSQNIETLIRNKITLSSTVDFVETIVTNYETIGEEETWNKVSNIELNCKKWSS